MKFRKKVNLNQDMVLQITSMADIFTILLVFLLKSFSSGASSISAKKELVLPEVAVSDTLTESTKIEIYPDSILLEDQQVTTLANFQFNPVDLESNGTPRSLNSALIKHKQSVVSQKYPKLMVFADKKTPYSVLKTILVSASNFGYEGYKLVVVENK